MRVKVKICGIINLYEALASIKYGADYLGFNFVAKSKRYISTDNAIQILKSLDRRKIKIVGVFQNEEPKTVHKIYKLLKLDLVQLHGEEEPNEYEELHGKIIKAFTQTDGLNKERLFSEMKKFPANYYLIDRKIQGKGKQPDFMKAGYLASKIKLFLAGGLTPDNVREAILAVRPFAVDVASGVETDGKKDKLKIKNFIYRAKGIS